MSHFRTDFGKRSISLKELFSFHKKYEYKNEYKFDIDEKGGCCKDSEILSV